ncbi:MAG: YegS/Rv2252/BmrU family lipid kinase [Bacteroidales bacterium]|nr:YegS/Rv2252/BmrU family lipid kinase [Bacteroidales bacterium]
MQTISSKDIIFIINPNSGKKQGSKYVNKINKIDPNISSVITANLNEMDKVFKENIEKFKVFIVVGGDGTVNEALRYLHERNDKFLGIVPAGSGNGFARELGFKKSIKSLIADVSKAESVLIDVFTINNNKGINAAGLGFDSFVAHDFQNRKGRGLINYIISTIKTIFIFKPFYVQLNVDNIHINDKFVMITIANTRQFGNNALIAPNARPDDGILELVLVKPLPFYLYPSFVIKLFSGKLKNSKYITYIGVKKNIEIKTEFSKYHVDGEPKLFEDHLSVDLLRQKIRIIKTSHNGYKIKS